MTNSTQPQVQAIVTKKVIYEVKFTGTPAKETRNTLHQGGLNFSRGQWSCIVSDGGLMTEEEVNAFFARQFAPQAA